MLIPDAPPLSEMAESAPTVPEATYNFRVHKSEYVAVPKSKDAKGPYIKCTHVITGPESDAAKKSVGRMVFQNYSLTGDGSFRLRELLTACGKPLDFKLNDSDELVGLEFKGVTVIQKGTGGYADKNEIRKHLPITWTPPAQA